jgi:hypothetical protein
MDATTLRTSTLRAKLTPVADYAVRAPLLRTVQQQADMVPRPEYSEAPPPKPPTNLQPPAEAATETPWLLYGGIAAVLVAGGAVYYFKVYKKGRR